MMRHLLLCLSLLSTGAVADNAELNEMLEQNAASAAHSRLCNEDPMSEQLKSSTMLVLALSGIAAENVQLGSAKFSDVMRKEMRDRRKDKEFQCARHIRVAEERLADAQRQARTLREATVTAPAPQ